MVFQWNTYKSFKGPKLILNPKNNDILDDNHLSEDIMQRKETGKIYNASLNLLNLKKARQKEKSETKVYEEFFDLSMKMV